MRVPVKVVALQLSCRTAWRRRQKICMKYNVTVYKIRTCCWLGCLALVGDRSYTYTTVIVLLLLCLMNTLLMHSRKDHNK